MILESGTVGRLAMKSEPESRSLAPGDVRFRWGESVILHHHQSTKAAGLLE
jgi:hypothetical protein